MLEPSSYWLPCTQDDEVEAEQVHGAEGSGVEDIIDTKIAEEHAKFLTEQAVWHERVRASRPWSAPPLSSPRPDAQRSRGEERCATATAMLEAGT